MKRLQVFLWDHLRKHTGKLFWRRVDFVDKIYGENWSRRTGGGNLEKGVLLSIMLVARNVGITTDDLIAAKPRLLSHTCLREEKKIWCELSKLSKKMTYLDSRVFDGHAHASRGEVQFC